MFKQAFIFLTVILFFNLPAQSQKVAVILSGGASRGGAHIGVLKALEEQHIPISCIAGYLYSCGISRGASFGTSGGSSNAALRCR